MQYKINNGRQSHCTKSDFQLQLTEDHFLHFHILQPTNKKGEVNIDRNISFILCMHVVYVYIKCKQITSLMNDLYIILRSNEKLSQFRYFMLHSFQLSLSTNILTILFLHPWLFRLKLSGLIQRYCGCFHVFHPCLHIGIKLYSLAPSFDCNIPKKIIKR